MFKSMLLSVTVQVTVGSQLRLFGILEAVRIVGTVPAYHALRDSSTIIAGLALPVRKNCNELRNVVS